jgi:hypothetical protein
VRSLLKRLWRKNTAAQPKDFPSQEQIEQVWDGTPFLQHFHTVRAMVVGTDGPRIAGLSRDFLAAANTAREQGNTEAVIHFLCSFIAANLIIADFCSVASALGNLALTYEQLSKFEIASRLQHYALGLKLQYGAPPEAIARSLWLIGRSKAALGQYADASEFFARSIAVQPSEKVFKQHEWIQHRIEEQKLTGELPPDL